MAYLIDHVTCQRQQLFASIFLIWLHIVKNRFYAHLTVGKLYMAKAASQQINGHSVSV